MSRNMLIVEEKLHSAEARAKRADTEVAKLSELPAAIEKLQTELFQWQREVMVSFMLCACPHDTYTCS